LVLDFLIGLLAYLLLGRMTKMRRIDKATVAGYYGSDSAGTFATCVGVLATVGVAFHGFVPVMLAVMEMPGCLVALYLAAQLRHRGMDAAGNMPSEPGYELAPKREPNYRLAVSSGPSATARPRPGEALEAEYERAIDKESELAPESPGHPKRSDAHRDSTKPDISTAKLLREVLLNPGLYLLFGGIVIGLISRLQGAKVVHDDDNVFVAVFKGVLCLFLLEMGMTASG
jgi:uncharacterized protein